MSRCIAEIIETSLRADREEGLKYGEVVAHELAVARCKDIACKIEPVLASDSKWVCFGEDGGGVTFVIRSLQTDRRVYFRIPRNGTDVTCMAIEKCTKATVQRLPEGGCFRLIALATWVNGEINQVPRQRAEG